MRRLEDDSNRTTGVTHLDVNAKRAVKDDVAGAPPDGIEPQSWLEDLADSG